MTVKVALIIPTYQAKQYVNELCSSIRSQTLQPEVLVIDSSSTDGTPALLRQYFRVHSIPKVEFNHGKTRQLALSLVDADIYVYLTQDAILANENSIANMVKVFENPQVGCAYGRQLPHKGAGLLGAHLRHFNYPEYSELRALKDIPRLGIKTCSNSNSFAAYRKAALEKVGGFPARVIVGEDVYVAAKMILAGWTMAYCAEAQVFHSHDYSVIQDFKRYFDVGVFHQQEHWIIEAFKAPGKLGNQYVKSELKWCLQRHAYLTPFNSIWHSGMKWLGYKLGRNYFKLPVGFRKKLSMHSFYWSQT